MTEKRSEGRGSELDEALDAKHALEGVMTAIVVRLNCAEKVRDLTLAEQEIRAMASGDRTNG